MEHELRSPKDPYSECRVGCRACIAEKLEREARHQKHDVCINCYTIGHIACQDS